MKENAKPELEESASRLTGIDELNLAELPIATLGRRDRASRKVLTCLVPVKIDGAYRQTEWTVSGASSEGLPTDFAERVMVILMAITHKQGYRNPERKVTFSCHQILQQLDLSIGSYNYNRIVKALRQLKGLTIFSDLAFRDAASGEPVTDLEGFNLVDHVKVKKRGKVETETYIVWGSYFWSNFQAQGGVKYLDLDFYLSLKSAVARRVYRILTKRFYVARDQDSAYHEEDVFQFATRVGLSRYPKPALVMQKLRPGIEELIERGFLLKATLVKHQGKTKKYTRIRLVKQPDYETTREREKRQQTQAELDQDLVITPQDRYAAEVAQQLEQYSRFGTTEAELKLWREVQTTLRGKVTQATYDLVFPNSMLLSVKNKTAMIGLHTSIAQEWAESRLYPVVSESLQAHLDTEPTSLVFITL